MDPFRRKSSISHLSSPSPSLAKKFRPSFFGPVHQPPTKNAGRRASSSNLPWSSDFQHLTIDGMTLDAPSMEDDTEVEEINQAYPRASPYRFAPVKNFDKLNAIFGKDRADGRRAIGPKQRQLQLAREKNRRGFDDFVPSELSGCGVDISEDDVGGSGEPQDESNTEASSAVPTSKPTKETKKRKTRFAEIVSEEMQTIKAGLDAVAAALDRGNLRNYTEEHLFKEIVRIGGMSDTSQMKVYQALTRDVSAARAFLACPVERRRLWLSVKFGTSFFDAL